MEVCLPLFGLWLAVNDETDPNNESPLNSHAAQLWEHQVGTFHTDSWLLTVFVCLWQEEYKRVLLKKYKEGVNGGQAKSVEGNQGS